MMWSETKWHEGMPYQESTEPRGYTVIAHDYRELRITTATYCGNLKDHHGTVGRLECERENSQQKKTAIRSLKAACEKHFAKITGEATASSATPAPQEAGQPLL